MTRISFIMPSFNRSHHIGESIESVLDEMCVDDELIVVDDGSVDNTQAVVAPYLGRLRYVRQDNAGKSVALNRGLEMTTGKYVWICDDDDLLLPGVVNSLHGAIETKGVDMVFGRYSRFKIENELKIDLGNGYCPNLSTGSLQRHFLEDMISFHNASIVRRATYNRLGPFDPKMLRSQDYEMFVRVALSCSIGFVDTNVFLQRVHQGKRGPANISHSETQAASVWRNFDLQIFGRLRDLVPLDFFVSMFDSPNAAAARRAGLLQRACILARHGLWADALSDCARAASACENHPLHPLEIATCRRMTAGKYGFAGLLEPGSAVAIRSLRQNRVGRAIAGEIARGLLWRLRSDDADARKAALRHLLHMPNAANLAARMLGAGKGGTVPQLREREPDIVVTEDALRQWRNAIVSPAFSLV
jgi:hypothetical protein